ncbi:integrase [Sinorhizobium medicae]|uniref:Integrase n=1 Tax=Sinorhizobium medicae TaxID=110321 RepID=A0ABX4TLI3_9HYPH|nr:integrase arm-type DNA-binding domain-containing protein [Sinorhizobium medicae]PLT98053.1 integrase [Sinorhizobium medicae]PLU03784.1 integrase [Sinorhizobium medicae]PLU17417.1 integrase [Sinorhizobium medicae]PLU24122.1 integrase [Sinorhizobium medicae]PLU31584.1 integrase [Sinorhizobium medicae]
MAKSVLNQKKLEAIAKSAAAKGYTVRTEIPDAGQPGLYLVVQPSGSMSWAFRYRHAGRPRKLTIGPFVLGEDATFTLAKAREVAQEASRIVSDGRDPAEVREEEKAQAPEPDPVQVDLVGDVLDEFVKRHVKKKNRESTQKNTEAFIDKRIRPEWKDRDIKSITKRDVVKLLDDIADDGAPESAARVRAILSKFFNWAVDRDIVDASPVPKGSTAKQGASRERVLTDQEVRLVWLACEKVGWPFGSLVKLLLLTVQRRNEVAHAARSEFKLSGNNQLWTIPPERSKNGKEHLVPLPSFVLQVISGLAKVGDTYLLSTTGETPVSGFSKAKKAIDAAMLEIAQEEASAAGTNPDDVKIERWTLHDLRRTGASGMARLGAPIHVVEAVLNHQSGTIKGVAKIYNRYEYLDEKRQALADWAGHVQFIAARALRDGQVWP